MDNNKKIIDKNLEKLEDEAYFELCQIIAEAMQYLDINLLNNRIAKWKNKYRKLLEQPYATSKLKKRIEYLLNQYYSYVTQYILEQLRLHEIKQIEHQAKALRKLYRIVKDTKDLDLLKKKVQQWKEKYPISRFLQMYKKRIKFYTREKNLKENAFEQEKAFFNLIDITKKHETLDELKKDLVIWEKTYSINNKYTIDDFIKHQREVKRYTSDEFLQSIAIKDDETVPLEPMVEYVGSFSSLAIQASAYASLIRIANSLNNVDEMFDWVYQNSNIKFNDKYKELILNATYLNYSPTFLNKLKEPKIDLSKDFLTLEEYENIDNIKRYAIISYFNLLLPTNRTITNYYLHNFNDSIRKKLYKKSEEAKTFNSEEEIWSNNKITGNSNIVPKLEIKENEVKEILLPPVNDINKSDMVGETDRQESREIEPIQTNKEELRIITNELTAKTAETNTKEKIQENLVDNSSLNENTKARITGLDEINPKKNEKKQDNFTDKTDKASSQYTVTAVSLSLYDTLEKINEKHKPTKGIEKPVHKEKSIPEIKTEESVGNLPSEIPVSKDVQESTKSTLEDEPVTETKTKNDVNQTQTTTLDIFPFLVAVKLYDQKAKIISHVSDSAKAHTSSKTPHIDESIEPPENMEIIKEKK